MLGAALSDRLCETRTSTFANFESFAKLNTLCSYVRSGVTKGSGSFRVETKIENIFDGVDGRFGVSDFESFVYSVYILETFRVKKVCGIFGCLLVESSLLT